MAAGKCRDRKLDNEMNFCGVIYKLLIFFVEPWYWL